MTTMEYSDIYTLIIRDVLPMIDTVNQLINMMMVSKMFRDIIYDIMNPLYYNCLILEHVTETYRTVDLEKYDCYDFNNHSEYIQTLYDIVHIYDLYKDCTILNNIYLRYICNYFCIVGDILKDSSIGDDDIWFLNRDVRVSYEKYSQIITNKNTLMLIINIYNDNSRYIGIHLMSA